MDFFYTMSYNGMKGLFVEASIPRATTYWVIARLIQSAGLLIAAVIPNNHKSKQNPLNYLIATGVFTYLIFYLVSFKIEKLPILFVPGQGLTATKIYLEYVIITFFVLTAGLILKDYQKNQSKFFMIYILGITFAIFAEASFTLYRSVYDIRYSRGLLLCLESEGF